MNTDLEPGTAAGQKGSYLWGPYSRVCALTAIAAFALDQSHKAWMLLVYQIQAPGRGRVAITPFLDLVYVLNKGVSYGLGAGIGPWLLMLFAVSTACGLWIWLARAGTGRLMAISLGLIIGGALANGLDRYLHGGVVDYFSLHAFGFYWDVVNIADAAIVAGVAALLYESYKTSRNDASNAA